MNGRLTEILLIEDNSGDARLLVEMLKDSGSDWWRLESASTLAEGMRMLGKKLPDVILLDLALPDSMDLSTFDNIHETAPETPIIVLSGLYDEEVAISAVRQGAQDYLIKGRVESDLLVRAIRYAIERKQIEEEVKRHRHNLEELVVERTAELMEINEKLTQEIQERKQVEDALKRREEELELNSRNIEEANTALRVLLKVREDDKVKLEQDVLANVKKLVFPFIEKLKAMNLQKNQMAYLETIENNLKTVVSPFLRNITLDHYSLTPREIEVANLVRDGRTTKDIAELLNISTKSVDFHRNNIRDKLGLKKRRSNLRSTLISIS
ncbi:MAG: response regulator [Deltaproteobacteria bacterium]|nr:response regulator [Deltaproteobacteria bacterium]